MSIYVIFGSDINYYELALCELNSIFRIRCQMPNSFKCSNFYDKLKIHANPYPRNKF